VAAGCGGRRSSTATGRARALAAAPGFDPVARTIHLGVISPLTGPVAAIGKPLTSGNEVWFKYVNLERGGIGGKYKVVLDEEDSQYNPTLAVQAYNKLKANETLFTQLLGTPSTKAVLPLLRADNIVAAPASLDADWVHEPNLIPVGGPYQIQMINGADWYLRLGGGQGKTMCSLIQDDAYGTAGQQGVDFAATELRFTVKTTAKFKQAAPDFTAQVQQLKAAGCQAIFLVSTPTDTGRILGTAAQLNFAPQWIGQSPSYIGALAASPLKDYLAAHFVVVAEGTEWGDQSVRGMRDMTERVQKYAPGQAPDYYFAFGYYEANAVTQILEKAVQLGDLSRAGILAAMERVGTLSFDGLSGDYQYGRAADRNPPRASTIFKINPTKPIGIEKVKYDFVSDAAKKYAIPTM
jgi:ABC-type branched-subunit amino acid transport system substrate-binding protein